MSTMTDNFQAELAEALKRFQAPEKPAPVIPDDVAAQARELDAVRDVIKIMKEREGALRTSILQFMAEADATSLSDGDVALNVTTQNRRGVDTKRLAALYPKVHAVVATETLVTQLRVDVNG